MPLRVTLTFLAALAVQACGSGGSDGGSSTQRVDTERVDHADGRVVILATEYTPEGFISRITDTRDGVVTGVSSFDTDAAGQLIRRLDDSDGDGLTDRSTVFEYINGLGLSRAFHADANGLFDGVTVNTFTGPLVTSSETRSIPAVDSIEAIDLSNSTLESRRLFTYSADQLTVVEEDNDGNGSIDTLTSWSYNLDGTAATATTTALAGGTVSSHSFSYEAGACPASTYNSVDAYACVPNR